MMSKASMAATLLGFSPLAWAAPAADGGSTSALVGLAVVGLVVACGYLIVFMVKSDSTAAVDSGDAVDFDKFTTASDRPSIERY